MTKLDLQSPRFAQPDVLRVTGLPAPVLQTWVNRGHVRLSEQNPGTGRRRLYSPIDVVKLAIMRRLYDFGINITYSEELAEDVGRKLQEKGEIEWNLYSKFVPSIPGVTITTAPRSMKFNYIVGDPWHMRVSELVEPPWPRRPKMPFAERMELLREKKQTTPDREVDPKLRAELAARGIHAEPALILPVGEIANGVLAMLKAIEDSEMTTGAPAPPEGSKS